MNFKDKLEDVRARISRAAERSGRKAEDVALLAVTKGAKPEKIREAHDAGLRLFAENRVQEAEAKVPAFDAEWHLVGHLQSNKVKAAVGLFRVIQSVDSVRLAKKIGEEAVAAAKEVTVLLEVNVSGEEQKQGFAPMELYGAIDEIAGTPGIKVAGLMGMAPLADEAARRESFKKLKNLFNVCKALKKPGVEMKTLSMGMSDDFEIAIEEGANMVRIGRALFA